MKKSSLFTAVFLVLILGITLQSEDKNKGVSIKGTVTDENEMILRKVAIHIGGLTAISDDNGKFVFENVPSGRHFLNAGLPGYLLSHRDSKGHWIAYISSGFYLSLDLDIIQNVELRMVSAPVVTGQVLDSNLIPVSRVQIYYFQSVFDTSGRRVLRRLPGGASTNDRGQYKIEQLAPGEYIFQFQNAVTAGDSQVTSSSRYYPGVVDSSIATPVAISAGITNLSPMVLPAERGSGLTIHPIDDTGQPIKGFVAMSVRRQGDLGASYELGLHPSLELAPGTYEIEAFDFKMIDMKTSPVLSESRLGRTTVEISDRNVELPLRISSGNKVEGRILKEESDGELRPLPGIQFQLNPKGFQNLFPFRAVSRKDGSFVLPSVPAGDYEIYIPAYGDNGGINFVGDTDLITSPKSQCVSTISQNDFVLSTLEALIREPTTKFQVVMRDSQLSLRVAVRDSSENPVDGAVVALVQDSVDNSRFRQSKAITADQNGMAEFVCSSPGRYRIYSWSDLPGMAFRNPEFMMNYEDLGKRIESIDRQQVSTQVQILDLK